MWAARNVVNVKSSDAVIEVVATAGILSEVALAVKATVNHAFRPPSPEYEIFLQPLCTDVLGRRMPCIKALVFDLDLTICENFDRKRTALERGLSSSIPEEFRASVVREYDFEKILGILGVEPSKDRVDKVLRHFFYDEDLFMLDRPIKGAVETLTHLAKKCAIFYVTARPIRTTATDFLKKFGFPVGGVYAQEGSQKVDFLREIVKRGPFHLEEVVAVGDLPSDAKAAKEVGIMAIGMVQFHKSMKNEIKGLCDYVIDRITELPSLLESICDSIQPEQ